MKTEARASSQILGDVDRYYSARLAEHGATPRGVDWNGEKSQTERFRQLTKIVPADRRFSLNDVGCGYGAILEYFDRSGLACDYWGYDISAAMIAAARQRHADRSNAYFAVGAEPGEVRDFGIASGIFNVKLNHDDTAWCNFIVMTLDAIDRTSRAGFSFNCLTSYSDRDKKRDHLFYADPSWLFGLCKERYARNVALLHDYGLYEFTILVRKEL